jgi:hypothetical protein
MARRVKLTVLEFSCFALWATSAVRALDHVRQRAAAMFFSQDAAVERCPLAERNVFDSNFKKEGKEEDGIQSFHQTAVRAIVCNAVSGSV